MSESAGAPLLSFDMTQMPELKDGDLVRVASPDGEVTFRVSDVQEANGVVTFASERIEPETHENAPQPEG